MVEVLVRFKRGGVGGFYIMVGVRMKEELRWGFKGLMWYKVRVGSVLAMRSKDDLREGHLDEGGGFQEAGLRVG